MSRASLMTLLMSGGDIDASTKYSVCEGFSPSPSLSLSSFIPLGFSWSISFPLFPFSFYLFLLFLSPLLLSFLVV